MSRRQSFTCARGIAPLMWMLFSVGIVELLVTHLLLAHWWPRVAIGVGITTAGALIWLAWAIVSLGRVPSTVDGESVVLRAGRFKSIAFEPGNVVAARPSEPADRAMRGQALNLALLAEPNVAVELRSPIARRGRTTRLVFHRLDEPAAFIAAVNTVAGAHVDR